MTPEQITDFVSSYLMMRGKPTEDGSFKATLSIGGRRGLKPKHPQLSRSQQTLATRPMGRKPNGSGFTAGHPKPSDLARVSPRECLVPPRSNRFNAPCGCLAVVVVVGVVVVTGGRGVCVGIGSVGVCG